MIRQAPKVWLSQEDRDDLERFSRSRTLSASLVQRAQIILRAALGQDNHYVLSFFMFWVLIFFLLPSLEER